MQRIETRMTRIYIELLEELAVRLRRDEPTGGRFVSIEFENDCLSMLRGGESGLERASENQPEEIDFILHPRARAIISELLEIDEDLGGEYLTLSEMMKSARRST